MRAGPEGFSQAFNPHKLLRACEGLKMSLVNNRDAQGGLLTHRIVYFTLDAELHQPYVLHFVASTLSRSGTDSKDFHICAVLLPLCAPEHCNFRSTFYAKSSPSESF